jgi:hypothetical protein
MILSKKELLKYTEGLILYHTHPKKGRCVIPNFGAGLQMGIPKGKNLPVSPSVGVLLLDCTFWHLTAVTLGRQEVGDRVPRKRTLLSQPWPLSQAW